MQINRPVSLVSFGAEQLYDKISYLFFYLASQFWRIPLSDITTILLVIHLMTFLIITGYGDSTKIYGGTRGNSLQVFTKETA